MDTINILIADEQNLTRQGIKHVLKDEKSMQVVGEVNSCKAAIEYLEQNANNISVIVMDLKFSKGCGKDVAKNFLKKYKHINILAFTNNLNEYSILSTIKTGALGYVLKDDSSELASAVKTVAKRNKYLSQGASVKMMNFILNEKKNKSPKLSNREHEVLTCIADGETNKEVGSVLSISSRTVETHRRNILKKLGVKNTVEMVRYAINHKLIA
jgi:DNA-binding NarL/FixJ family response regulator